MNSSDEAKIAFSARLNDILTERGYAQRGRAQRLKKDVGFEISDRAINKWLRAESIPDHHNLAILVRFLGVSFNWLAAGQGERSPKPSALELMQKIKDIENNVAPDGMAVPKGTRGAAIAKNSDKVPVLSWVAAGSWSNVEPVSLDDALGEVSRPSNLSKNGFALIVQGESMLPKFDPGDIIYVEPETGLYALKNNDLVIVQCNDDTQATFKQLVIGETPEDMYLRPLNPNWPEQKMLPMGECNLVGKVVGKYVEY